MANSNLVSLGRVRGVILRLAVIAILLALAGCEKVPPRPPAKPVTHPVALRLNMDPRVERTMVDDRGRLVAVFLIRQQVDDESIQLLRGLAEVEYLDLVDTRLTDAGLAALTTLPSLAAVHLTQTQISDEGARQLAEIPTLRVLYLDKTRVTDEGARALAKLSALEELHLDHTQVGDASLADLAGLPKLRELHVTHTLVTQAGAEQFRREHPRVQLFWGDSESPRAKLPYQDEGHNPQQ